MTREMELLMARATALTCGVVGHAEDEAGAETRRIGGSGVFVAPCQAITARHVIRDLFATDSNRADDLRRKDSGYFGVPHSIALFQIHNAQPSKAATWGVTRTWDPTVTDICLLEAAPDNPAGHDMLSMTRGMFSAWSLLPPPVGTQVEMFGMPSTEITSLDGGAWNIRFPFTLQQAVVSEVCDIRHDRGLYSFPGFVVDQPTDPGFSGGPVFWDGRLSGIVSGGLFGHTYIASLWPLCLMEIEYPNLGILNRRSRFGDWFDERRLVSPDWPNIKERVSRRFDDAEKPYAHLEP